MPQFTYANQSVDYKTTAINEDFGEAQAYAVDTSALTHAQIDTLRQDIANGQFSLPDQPQSTDIEFDNDPENPDVLFVVVVVIRLDTIDWLKIALALRGL